MEKHSTIPESIADSLTGIGLGVLSYFFKTPLLAPKCDPSTKLIRELREYDRN